MSTKKQDGFNPKYYKKSRKALFTESPFLNPKPQRKSVHVSKPIKTTPISEIKNKISKLIETENKQHEAKIKSLENILLMLDGEDTDEVSDTPVKSRGKENIPSMKKLQQANDIYNSMRVGFCTLETPKPILMKLESKLNKTSKSTLSKTLQEQCLLLCETPSK